MIKFEYKYFHAYDGLNLRQNSAKIYADNFSKAYIINRRKFYEYGKND